MFSGRDGVGKEWGVPPSPGAPRRTSSVVPHEACVARARARSVSPRFRAEERDEQARTPRAARRHGRGQSPRAERPLETNVRVGIDAAMSVGTCAGPARSRSSRAGGGGAAPLSRYYEGSGPLH